jgi:P-type E1-E2 ATPase
MIRVEVPGWRTLALRHLVLDLNGTVALDGEVLPGVAERLSRLAGQVEIHLATADSRGQAEATARRLGVALARVERGQEAGQKEALVARLGGEQVAAMGNGANDAGMLAAAGLGIAVLGREGLAVTALQAADVVVAGIDDGLDLLLQPQRLAATLRR